MAKLAPQPQAPPETVAQVGRLVEEMIWGAMFNALIEATPQRLKRTLMALQHTLDAFSEDVREAFNAPQA